MPYNSLVCKDVFPLFEGGTKGESYSPLVLYVFCGEHF